MFHCRFITNRQLEVSIAQTVIPLCHLRMTFFDSAFPFGTNNANHDAPNMLTTQNQPRCSVRSLAVLIVNRTVRIFHKERNPNMTGVIAFLVPLVHLNDTHDELHVLYCMDRIRFLIKIRHIKGWFCHAEKIFARCYVPLPLAKHQQHRVICMEFRRDFAARFQPTFIVADTALVTARQQFDHCKPMLIKNLLHICFTNNIFVLHGTILLSYSASGFTIKSRSLRVNCSNHT